MVATTSPTSDPFVTAMEHLFDRVLTLRLEALLRRVSPDDPTISCTVAEAARRTGCAETVIRLVLREHPNFALKAGSKYLIHWPAFAAWWATQRQIEGDRRSRRPVRRKTA